MIALPFYLQDIDLHEQAQTSKPPVFIYGVNLNNFVITALVAARYAYPYTTAFFYSHSLSAIRYV